MASLFDDGLQPPQELPAATTSGSPFFQTGSVEEQPGDVDDYAFDRFSTPVKEADGITDNTDEVPPAVSNNHDLLNAFGDGGTFSCKADEQSVVCQDSLLDAFTEVPQQPLEGSSAREQDITVSVDSEDDPARDFIERERELLASFNNESSVESVVDSTSPFAQSSGIGGNSFDGSPSRGASYGPSPVPSSGVKELPEPIRIAQQEMRERLQKKDAEEAVRILELKETARQELEHWYARYNEQVGKTKARNKETQEVFVEERDRLTSEKGKEWERLGSMCDFSNKGCRGTKDVSRMRSILMQLKQKPPAVPVLE